MKQPIACAWILFAGMAYAQEPEGEHDVGHASRWDMAGAAGVSSVTEAMPGMQLMGAASRTIMPGAVSDRRSSLQPSFLLSLRYRIRERVLWSVPTLSFAYLGGTSGEREWIPWAGLTSWGLGYSSIEHLVAQGGLGVGIGVREWLGGNTAFNITTAAASSFDYRSTRACAAGEMCASWSGPTQWVASATAGISRRFGDTLTVNLGVGASLRVLGDNPEDGSDARISFGSVQSLGLRQLPLLQAQLSQRWFLDGHALASYDVTRDRVEQRCLVGFTHVWPSQ